MPNIIARINLKNLEENYKNLKNFIGKDSEICAVVKANAYGHGSVGVAKFLESVGVKKFAVARLEEATRLRENGIKGRILLLGHFDDVKTCVKNEFDMSVYSLKMAKEIDKVAKKLAKKARVHISLDTGMGRLGFVVGENPSKIVDKIYEISKLKNIKIAGIFTHFSNADESGDEFSKVQLEKFQLVTKNLEEMGVNLGQKHIANSAGVMKFKGAIFDMVRIGLGLYGYYPNDELKGVLKLKPVMRVDAKITNSKLLSKNSPISYGIKYRVVDEVEKIVTISIGYADGFVRSQKGADILINGVKCPVVGTITMDQCMVKVPLDMKIKVGKWANIFGSGKITADDLAKRAGTISYEILCGISRRIPRVFVK